MKTNSENSNGSPSARELRRQNKASQIVKAATEVFLEDGFAAATMDRIVECAGISKRTLYNYYPSKDEVFIDVIQMQLGAFFENFSLQKQVPADLAEQLRRVGIELLKVANQPATLSLFRMTAAEAQRFPKLAHQFFEHIFENVIEVIAEILEREGKSAKLKIKDSRRAGEHYIDLLTGTAFLRVIFGTTPPMKDRAIKKHTDQALHYFLSAYR